MPDVTVCDVVVIGAGIAGASAAAMLGAQARVVVLERESQPGYHTTGRSAALFTETYGSAVTRALTVASRGFLTSPPHGFTDHPLLLPRGVMIVGPRESQGDLERQCGEFAALVPSVRMLDATDIGARVPVLRAHAAACALLEPDAMDIDVHAVHRGYLRTAQSCGTQIVCDVRIDAIERTGGEWTVLTGSGAFRAPVLVNAAGAWVDEVGALAGVSRIGIEPRRRTVITFDPPEALSFAHWPMVMNHDETLYFKPDAGRILVSPADETPSPPCDAQPDEMDIAITVDRLEQLTTFSVARLKAKWAGLRSFVSDRTLVAGFDPDAEGFLWLTGQGGYGIQTSPAMGQIAAAAVLGQPFPESARAVGLTPESLSPARLR